MCAVVQGFARVHFGLSGCMLVFARVHKRLLSNYVHWRLYVDIRSINIHLVCMIGPVRACLLARASLREKHTDRQKQGGRAHTNHICLSV